MVWQSEADEIAVIGVYIDLDAQIPVTELAVKRQLPDLPEGVQQMGTIAVVAVTPDDSVLLETVLATVDEITEPGTFTETGPLIMSELVDLLSVGNFQR